MKKIERTSVRTSAETYAVEAEAVRLGADVLVYIWGGEKPHIGAVAAAQPRTPDAGSELPPGTESQLRKLGYIK